MNHRKLGGQYERIAGEYLELNGYKIIEYNFRCRNGEIDIIAKDGEYLVFCEVKYRQNLDKGSPFDAVTVTKQKRISKTAMYYLMKNHLQNIPCRFDVIGILGNKIEIIKDAFQYLG